MEEVESTILHIGSYKEPNLNGYGACFYQDHWSVVAGEVSQDVLSFLVIEDINFALVVIPKNSNPQKINEYQPIRLCNDLYKIITKILAKRLKSILPSIISQNQCAFVPDWWITNNILAAYETLYTMHTYFMDKKIIWLWNWIWKRLVTKGLFGNSNMP